MNIPAVKSQSDANGDIVLLYAAKHNPFVYFRSVQEGRDPRNSLANVVGFDGPNGLYQDLGSGNVPDFALIAPTSATISTAAATRVRSATLMRTTMAHSPA